MRILIVRLSAIGDVAITTAILPVLRSRFPDARIDWLAEPAGTELLQDHPEINRLLRLPRQEWAKRLRRGRVASVCREARAFVRELQAVEYDLALDLQGLLKSALWLRLCRARERVLLGSREGARYLAGARSVPRVQEPTGAIGQEYIHLAREMGWPAAQSRLDLKVDPAARARVRHWLEHWAPERSGDASPADGPLLFFSFTTRPQKHWFEERWVELGVRLVKAHGRRVVLAGGPGDGPAAERLAERIRSHAGVGGDCVASFAGRDWNLRDKLALIEASCGSVGVDTGLTHMAIGLGRPTVALFGSTCVYGKGPEGAPVRVLYEGLPCSPCHRHPSCFAQYTCMRLHDTGKVERALCGLLERSETNEAAGALGPECSSPNSDA